MSAYVPTLGTILVAIITAGFGIYSYRQQKRVDHANYIDEKATDRIFEVKRQRRKAYERYLTAYRARTSLTDFHREFTENSMEVIEAETEYWVAYSNLFQVASQKVVLSVAKFHKFAWLGETDSRAEAGSWEQEFKSLYARMIIDMRTSAYESPDEKSDLSPEEIEQYAPFNFRYTAEVRGAGRAQPEKREQAQ